MLDQILASFLEGDQVLFDISIRERFSRSNFRPTAVHLECTSSSDNDSGVWHEPTHTTLDVAEFLHAHVSTETAFSEDITDTVCRVTLFCAGKFQSNTVGKNRRVAMCYISKGTSVNKNRRSLQKKCQDIADNKKL